MDIVALLQANSALFIAISVLFGLLIGSFLNVVIHRLPIISERETRAYCAELLGQTQDNSANPPFNLWTPRSRCPACGHTISAAENIPLVSYILQRGRCRSCAASISIQYPLIELISGVLAGVVAWRYGFGPAALAAMLLTWALIALSAIDIEHQELPDVITLPFVWIGLGLALVPVFVDLKSSVIGAMAGYLSLWSVYHLFRLLTGKEGMGYGDFKLLAVFGAWLGWQPLVTIIILSSLVGAVVGVTLVMVRGRDRNLPIPFGPFLASAGWITLLWGEQLQRAYFNWSGL